MGSAALLLCVLEAAFRILHIEPRQLPPMQVQLLGADGWRTVDYGGTSQLKQQSPFPGVPMGEWIPGSSFRFLYYDDARDVDDPAKAARIATASINRHGLRGPDFPQEKPTDRRRVLFLGDSFTFGAGVDDARTFSALTERCLNDGAEAGAYHVINAGVSGYNTDNEVLYLEKRWLALEPDQVVLVFYLNDAYDDDRFAALMSGGGPQVHADVVASRSRLLGWLRTRWQRHRASRKLEATYRAQFSGDAAIAGRDWGACQDAIARAAELLRGRRIPFSVVLFPEMHALDDSHPFLGIYAQVRSAVESLGVPVVDLFPAFRGRNAEELWVHATDHHPNEAAHEIAAGVICPHVRKMMEAGPPP